MIAIRRRVAARHDHGLAAHLAPDAVCAGDLRGVSNGPTEAVNALTKRVKRVGHGFRNLANYRLLLAVGLDWATVPWQPAPATPIRGRSPRLVA